MVSIREGLREDLDVALELIKELAKYERAPHEVFVTVEEMEKDGFGKNPVFRFIVAENEDGIIGMSLYYFRYSTWKGKMLYLEDLIVREAFRGSGVGRRLFERTVEIAKEASCSGIMWQVLDWNEPAINFYKKYATRFDSEWVNCSIEF